jgi:ComF family protein
MENFLKAFWTSAADLLFPPRCEVCGLLQEPVICQGCHEQFQRISLPYCAQCGLPFDPLAQAASHCVECRENPPSFDAARAAGIYDGPLRQAIHVYKYEMVRCLGGPLGDFLENSIELPFPLDVLCPVPLHPSRERMRGFNQSLLLAEPLARAHHIPLEPHLLRRTQNTTPQMSLPHEQRRANVKGAFVTDENVAQRVVGVVDDVFTTGSTLRECSRVLKRAGAQRVLVITLARTVMPGLL